MKSILILPIFRFGNRSNSITIIVIEIFYRIHNLDFSFTLNVDSGTYKQVDVNHKNKLEILNKSYAYIGPNLVKMVKGQLSTLKSAKKADYIICETEYFFSVVYSYIIHLISGKPLIITIHQMDPDMYRENNSIHSHIYHYIFRKVNRFFILDNDEIINEFKLNFPEVQKEGHKIFRIINGVDVNSYYTSENKKYDLIYIGTIEERKNALLLPDIVEKVKSEYNNVKMLIISHKGNIQKLKKLIVEKKLEANVEIVNYVSEKEKRNLLATSKLLLLPSKYEGFGVPIIEAMASSIPAILFDVPSLASFNIGVLKSQPFKINDYANIVTDLLKNEEKRKKIGIEGRRYVKMKFDYDIASTIENESIKMAVKDLR